MSPISSLFAATTYYIDYVGGNDTDNLGTSKEAPWKHAPGMTGCSGNCAAYEAAHNSADTTGAGNSFIFKGGVTWPLSVLPFDWTHGRGTDGNTIYFGVDVTWYTGESWTRPVLDAEGGTPTHNGNTDSMVRFYGDGYVIDNIELKRMNQADDPANDRAMMALGTSSACSVGIEVKNCYFHGWGHVGDATKDRQLIISSGLFSQGPDLKLSIHNNVIDGSDTADKASGRAYSGSAGHIYNNYFGDLPSALKAGNYRYVWGNTFKNVGIPRGIDCSGVGKSSDYFSFDCTAHGNVLQSTCGSYTFYNNYMYNVGGGTNISGAAPVGSTSFLFNNVAVLDTNQTNQITNRALDDNGSTIYIFNNTYESSVISALISFSTASESYPYSIEYGYVYNNQIMGPNPTTSFGSTLNQIKETNIEQTKRQANSYGYYEEGTYPYYPPSASGLTVDNGTDLSSVCSTIVDDTVSSPSVACLSDTTLGVTYDNETHTVTGDGRVAVLRGSSWDIGAYEYLDTAPTASHFGGSGSFNKR